MRANDGFQRSDENDKIAGELSRQGLFEFGPSGGALSDEVISAVERDDQGRELYEEYPGGFSLLEFGPKVPIFAVESIAGTAACQTVWFFRRTAGKIEALASPAKPVGGCSGDFAKMGQVAGVPVIIQESHTDVGSKMKFLAWRGDAWERLCSLTATYQIGFEVVEEQCSGEKCREFKSRVTSWAEAVQNAEAGKPVPTSVGLKPVIGVPDKELNARNFETGLAPKPNFRQPSFLWGAPLFHAELDGKIYRVRVGRLDWGASVSRDQYLVTIFDGEAASQPPIAGYVIQERRKGLSSLSVESGAP